MNAVAELSERQKRFCEVYASNPNATAAAQAAGYSARTAAAQASRLLRNVKVKSYLNELRRKTEGERIADAIEVQVIWTNLLRDSSKPPAARIRAGELLMRAGGAFIPEDESLPDDESNDAPKICMPWVRGQSAELFNAIDMEDGTIVPLFGAEDLELLYYISPFRPDQMRAAFEPENYFEAEEIET